jgi:hypothetical protein
MNTNFPENIFDSRLKNPHIYKYKVDTGLQIAKSKKIVFAGICRNVEDTIALNIERMHKTSNMFKDFSIFLYENDSEDNTVSILESYRTKTKLEFLSEKRDDKDYRRLVDDGTDPWHFGRCKILAQCRNKYLDHVISHYADYDYLCILDLDIKGGWSYTGFQHGIFTLESDPKNACVSAYGVLTEANNIKLLEDCEPEDYIMYDSLAFRPFGKPRGIHILNTPMFNKITFDRGDQPLKVSSNFGGMSIYRLPLLKNKKYGARQWEEGEVDPDHVILNEQLINEGYNIILDPSMIVSYSDHKFSRNTNDKLINTY